MTAANRARPRPAIAMPEKLRVGSTSRRRAGEEDDQADQADHGHQIADDDDVDDVGDEPLAVAARTEPGAGRPARSGVSQVYGGGSGRRRWRRAAGGRRLRLRRAGSGSGWRHRRRGRLARLRVGGALGRLQ